MHPYPGASLAGSVIPSTSLRMQAGASSSTTVGAIGNCPLSTSGETLATTTRDGAWSCTPYPGASLAGSVIPSLR